MIAASYHSTELQNKYIKNYNTVCKKWGLQYARWELSTQHAEYVIVMKHADHRERVQHALTKQKMQHSFCSGSYIACRSI